MGERERLIDAVELANRELDRLREPMEAARKAYHDCLQSQWQKAWHELREYDAMLAARELKGGVE
jgi:hypothetical protein